MNKKKYMIILFGVMLIASVSAIITLENGNKIVSDAELEQVTDQQISNYMDNNLEMTRYKKVGDDIVVYYNVTYLEPTHNNDTYRVFTQEKPFKIPGDLWELCINKTTNQNCRDFLADRQTPYYLIENYSVIREVTEYNNVSREREVEVYDEFGNITLVNETYYEIEPYRINKTFYEIVNTTIKSTWLMASEEQSKQELRAIEFRDKSTGNNIDELFNMI